MTTRQLFLPILLTLAGIAAGTSSRAEGAEVTRLAENNWDALAPAGKEVDCIYGDFVLQNDVLVAVIGDPLPSRHANMTVRDVGGSVIDLTRRDAANDQLSSFYPTAREYAFQLVEAKIETEQNGISRATLRLTATAEAGKPQVDLEYRLADGDTALTIETRFSNPHSSAIAVELRDALRADRSFEFDVDASLGLFSAHDEWWRQAYGVLVEQHTIEPLAETVDQGRPFLSYKFDDQATIQLPPGETHTVVRKLVPAANLLQLKGLCLEILDRDSHDVRLKVSDADGPISLASVVLTRQDTRWGDARTNADGEVHFRVPAGEYSLHVDVNGRPTVQTALRVEGSLQESVTMARAGYVVAEIHDEFGRPIPCKVEFQGKDGTPDPYFGPDTFVFGIHNLRYTPDGRFRQPIGPGHYDVIVSRGNEYDAFFTSIEVKEGEDTPLIASLRRSVDTQGWISSEFHSHSSPSGDNTSSQRGRVLNLLCEHIEFAPCTEHNRVSTYVPHLEYFNAQALMATCSGMELTGRPLPVNHQNAFPLNRVPRTQDGGAPQTDENPVLQIERLAFWDQRAQKVVQGNHPNLMQVFGDKDLDGSADGGFARMLELMDVVEVHPPHMILSSSPDSPEGYERGNVIFNWLQLLNQGFRIPGVVNTDAHYNFHGSGWLRNYLKSETDDPSQLKLATLIRTTEQGNIVMTNGPFLETFVRSISRGTPQKAYPGDDLLADEGQISINIRVQCANWLDINRVQIYLNGVPASELNYTRRTHPDYFSDETVKFDRTVALKLRADTHVIVAAAGEGLALGPVVGPDHRQDIPIAVSNPVFVDVDENGFQPNGDNLGHSLPIK